LLKFGHRDKRSTPKGAGPKGRRCIDKERSFRNDCWLKCILTHGVDVTAVSHGGRNIPTHIRTALEARDQECVVPGCHVRQGLEIDHWKIPYHEGGPTELWNLGRACGRHHYEKTYLGARLEGGPGHWVWHPPTTAGPPSRTRRPPPARRPSSGAAPQPLAFDQLNQDVYEQAAPP